MRYFDDVIINIVSRIYEKSQLPVKVPHTLRFSVRFDQLLVMFPILYVINSLNIHNFSICLML